MKCDDDSISQLMRPVAFHERVLFWAKELFRAQYLKILKGLAYHLQEITIILSVPIKPDPPVRSDEDGNSIIRNTA